MVTEKINEAKSSRYCNSYASIQEHAGACAPLITAHQKPQMQWTGLVYNNCSQLDFLAQTKMCTVLLHVAENQIRRTEQVVEKF